MQTLLSFLVVIGVLVTAHEFGHYVVARWCGVRVLRFSVGFGKVLWSRRVGPDQTEWAIAAFPLGGYVKMLDEREGEVAETELPRAFNRQPVWRRSLIVLAGPLANFLVAILLYWVLFMHGTPELRPILAEPPSQTAAADAGLRGGERVRAVNDVPVATWDEFRWQLLEAHNASDFRLEVIDPNGTIATRVLRTGLSGDARLEGDALQRIGLRPYRPDLPPIIGALTSGGAAERAGLMPGDRVLAVDGVTIASWRALVDVIRDAAARRLAVEIERAGARLQISIVPASVQVDGVEIGRIGAAVQMPERSEGEPLEMLIEIAHPPGPAARMAIRETYDKSLFTLKMFGRMLTGEVSWKHLSGPVTIADYAGQSARAGWTYYLKFMALVSISLGVLNLLPIPVLDGGHLMYYACEVIKRGPLTERTQEIGQQIGVAALVLLMAFAFYNDLQRLLFG